MALISRELIDDLFRRSREDYAHGRSTWSIDSVCLWSFFFVHRERDFLLAACHPLHADGFTFYGTLDPDGGDESQDYYARYDRVELHTPESLERLSQRLHAYGLHVGVEFDGMDAGARDGSPDGES